MESNHTTLILRSFIFYGGLAKRKQNQSEGLAEFPPHPPSAKPEHRIEPRHLPEYLEGRTPKKNVLSIFRKNRARANQKSKRHFSLVSAEALRGGGGASSFVLEIGSSKVYNYSTSSNLFGIKNMERFCRSQNRALIFAKTLSAYGGSREIP